MSLGKDIRTREQASGSRAYLETRLSCLGTRFPVPEDFLERVREGIILNLSDTSQRSEEKHLEPSFKVANSAVFSTSAVTVANRIPVGRINRDQPLVNLFYLRFLQKNFAISYFES